MEGESLIKAVNGGAWRETVIGQHEFGDLSNHYIVSSHDKYLYFDQSGMEQYFDLDADPDESHNAVHDAAYQKRIATLREQLKRYRETESTALDA